MFISTPRMYYRFHSCPCWRHPFVLIYTKNCCLSAARDKHVIETELKITTTLQLRGGGEQERGIYRDKEREGERLCESERERERERERESV